MTRELKLALIVGFALVLLVAVLISDHLSDARQAKLADASDKPGAYITEPVAPPASQPGSVRSGPLASASRTGGLGITDDVKKAPDNALGSAWTTDPLAVLRAGTGPVAVVEKPSEPVEHERTLASASHPAIPTPEHAEPAVPTITQKTHDAETASLEEQFRKLGYAINDGTIEKMPVAARIESVTVSNPTTGVTTGAIGAPESSAAPTRVIPVVPESTRGTLAKGTAKASATPAEKVDDGAYYTISSGDSLYKIAKKFYGNGEEWRRIADANKLSGNANLKIGTKIRIPGAKAGASTPVLDSILNAKSEPKPGATPAPAKDAPKGKPARPSEPRFAEAPSKAEKPKATTYVVQSGDTLGQIAKKKLGSSRRADEIIALNPDALSDPDDLYVGLAIRLPSR